ncbi:carbamoyl-phosphate synthase large subunit [Pigmentibacter sp. JX0631]|uniref:carbamoyl-phosphate synthase large subunit n=1 Tax=Pigmentibacter sp. JX0631 TaxID=2976982 RepID=UPI002469901C|nr:carbamoyl-phosphate synthase large subunit [Pigmentibacter sp. JX0631]WGL60871.1 carbamoyl-phosphate synthase large subunit [Pigmentibacter sp. JX0631]
MPKNLDLKKILIIGSGPIQIGQGCEFDYSGTQACLALKAEGYQIILINSNPATIMTDKETADKIYIEPITIEYVSKIIQDELPDAILPTMGGQVALNLFMELTEKGILSKYNVKNIGVDPHTVSLAEDRKLFKNLVLELGYDVVKGDLVQNKEEAIKLAGILNFPLIIRASFTLGGTGGGIAYNHTQFLQLIEAAFSASANHEILIEESIIGWKEYELEVMRDCNGNFAVICGIENINPMGVHTGDSITIAPCVTLTDKEYQFLRNTAKDIFEKIGMKTGGANIQFAIHPDTGRVVVIEMNPRVSRSSALVSKATGYPIARISAKLAVGITLDEIKNEITKSTSAAFEPAIDYVVVKIPRWDFEKYKDADPTLGIQMKSVGEVIAFGRCFKDAFQKAWRSLEQNIDGWQSSKSIYSENQIKKLLSNATPSLFSYIKDAFYLKISIDEIYNLTKISKWFLYELKELFDCEQEIIRANIPLEYSTLFKAKRYGFSNQQISELKNLAVDEIERYLMNYEIKPTFKMVDTCAGEFEAQTPYYFKTYESFNENKVSKNKKIVILGSGPNRIGQGVEFDYSCVHAVKAVQELGYEAILINSNPETVSTDFYISDKLYMEPLTNEDVLDILQAENPAGVLIQFGGQSPLKLAKKIEKSGFKILGTSFKSIELAEDRKLFGSILQKNKIAAPKFSTALTKEDAIKIADEIKYPVLIRPSFVLGGRGMAIVYTEKELIEYFDQALDLDPSKPVLIDKYLNGAIEFDIDLLCDGKDIFIPEIMEHIEEAGIHSGDSSCIIPPLHVNAELRSKIFETSKILALELAVIGLMNIQFALYTEELYVLEVNPRSSRSIPFLSKATGISMANLGTKICLGMDIINLTQNIKFNSHEKYSLKVPVFPFHKFPSFTPKLGPEMRSIGEVMVQANTLGELYAKGFIAAGYNLNLSGEILNCTKDIYFKVLENELAINTKFTSKIIHLNKNSDKNNVIEMIKNNKIAILLISLKDSENLDLEFIPQLLKVAVQYKVPIASTTRSTYSALKALLFLNEGM